MTSGSDDALATHELDLVTRASKGDAEAFDRFYERNAGGVQLLVERLLGPGPIADTVVLEAFEKTVRRLPLLGARNSSPRLYVLTTARNGAYAALGRERPEVPKGPVAALLALPSRQRELLALRELGLSEAECAEVAGIEPAEVGVQIARGRLRLTDGLEDASLSGVFAEPRAERLLAAEVVRQDGASLPPELEQETTQLADSDARFAAALSAVRSPSRSVGQLPPATGASRLAAIARDRIVMAGAAGAAGALASAAPAAAAPQKPPARTSDPYDAQIGDEAAWGIVDDDDADEPAPAAPAPPADGPAPTGAPSQEAWDSGTPSAPEPPAPAAPTPAAAGLTPGAADVPAADAPLDELAGWDALDWDEDDRNWTAGPDAAPPAVAPVPADDPTVGAPIAAAPSAPEPVVDPDQTRPFDVVGAGLADPDDEAAVTSIAPGPPAGFDFGGGDTDEPIEEERRSPWRFLLWVIGFALLFAGVAFAAYTWKEARDSPDAPPASTIQPTTSTTPAKDDAPATSGSSKSGSSSSKDSKSPSSSPTDRPRSTSSSSSGSSSGGSSSSGSSSSGSTGGGSTSSGNSSSGSSGSSGSTTTEDRTVSGGEETSGGSVRGDTGTTP